jgi:Ca2+-binding EF-hand superfamily protein
LKPALTEHVFHLFDVNDKKCIDFTEFCVGLSKCLVSSKEVKTDFIFSMYDLDQDGQLSSSEIQNFLKGNPDAVKMLGGDRNSNLGK